MMLSWIHILWNWYILVFTYYPGSSFSLESSINKEYLAYIATSIKLKIAQQVRASLLELEFDWLSEIPYWKMWVVFTTDWLLNKSTMVTIEMELWVQIVLVPYLQSQQHKIKYWVLFINNPFKINQTGLFSAGPL